MRRKKLLVIILLLIATIIIYALVLYRSIQTYEDWKQAKLEEYAPELRPYVDFAPYTGSIQGSQMILLGAIIGIGWLTAITILGRNAPKN